jgi:hypothetical protein
MGCCGATDYGVFPANHVQTIAITPLDTKKAELTQGTGLIVRRRSSNMWRRAKVVQGPGHKSKQVKIHFVGSLKVSETFARALLVSSWSLPEMYVHASATASVPAPVLTAP